MSSLSCAFHSSLGCVGLRRDAFVCWSLLAVVGYVWLLLVLFVVVAVAAVVAVVVISEIAVVVVVFFTVSNFRRGGN
jgi:hypothetical protein